MTHDLDYRVRMINTLLVNPIEYRKSRKRDSEEYKRRREQMISFHKELMEKAPVFYGKLGYWYLDNGEIRDHKEMFICNMFVSDLGEHREAAHVVVGEGENFAPHQIARILTLVEDDLSKNVPRSMKTAITKWFDRLQNDRARFDCAVLQDRRSLRFLARRLHLRLTEYARNILFKKDYPAGSVFSKLKEMSTTEMKPKDIAKIIIEYNIPYRLATPYFNRFPPAILDKVIEHVSVEEITNVRPTATSCEEAIDLVMKIMQLELPKRSAE